MDSADRSLVHDEVEVLKAIYGDDQIAYHPRDATATPATVSISLATLLHNQPHPAGTDITLSVLLPDNYPQDAPPKTPTLRADALSAATCSMLVQRMLQRQNVTLGEVCMFEYCEVMMSVLNEFAAELEAAELRARVPSGMSVDEQDTEQRFVIYHGEPLTDRKSVFQAHIARVTCMEDVNAVLQQLKDSNRKIATATHNTLAYRIASAQGGALLQDTDDDGEKGAGKCVLYVLQQMEVVNVLCVVSRWFGGMKLGSIRFKHISKVARDLMEEHLAEYSTVGSAKR